MAYKKKKKKKKKRGRDLEIRIYANRKKISNNFKQLLTLKTQSRKQLDILYFIANVKKLMFFF